MMQVWLESDVITFVLLLTLIAFIMLIAIGMFRFSRNIKYKLWSIGWILFTASGGLMLLPVGQDVAWSNGIGWSGMLLGSLLLLDGTHQRNRKGRELLLYPFVVLLGFILLVIGMIFQLPYQVVLALPGLYITFVCWSCAIHLRKTEMSHSAEYFVLFIGFIFLGYSTLLYLFSIFWDIELVLALSMSSGLILTGCGMFAFFIRKTSEELTVQYQISQLMSGILNHDIRNYISSLSTSIEYARESESDRESWLDLASEIIASVEEFVLEMRRVMATTTRFRAERDSVVLLDILNEVSTRVEREYKLVKGSISVEVPNDLTVLTSKIVKELLWNISDNSFKHGSKILVFKIRNRTREMVTLVISDIAGGMPPDVRGFLNNPNAFSSPIAPGMGLGIILIRGLSLLCGIKVRVDDNISESGVVGTTYYLTFDSQDHDKMIVMQENDAHLTPMP